MCRIAGFWDFNYKYDYDIEDVVISMRDTLTYGGPDDAGVYIEKDKGLALGNRRLAILDLSSLGHQPMSDEEKKLWITYNGEVYNFKEIREELINKGYDFKSNTDTEVVLNAYIEWGLESVNKFRGMFAFAIWDKRKEKLILCRDRTGVKPLYWYYRNGLFMFASELKAFHEHHKFYKELDKKALSSFLTFGYIPYPQSIFSNTYKLEPGHFMIIDKDKNIKKIKYWDVRDFYLKGVELEKSNFWAKKSEAEITEELEIILRESFRLRMIADVPVGIFLSGGIDSSLVTAILSCEGFKLNTFTVGFYEDEFNEAAFAKKIADFLGTEHTQIYCTAKDAFSVIPKLPEIYDEPFGDVSAIPNHLVCILAKQRVKASLSASGGDELFCGYPRYWIIDRRLRIINRLPDLSLISSALMHINPDLAINIYKNFKFILPKYSNLKDKYMKFIEAIRIKDLEKMYLLAASFFLKGELKELTLPEPYNFDIDTDNMHNLHKMMFIDFKTYLPGDILTNVDRASMSTALEAREPFLDNKIIEYVTSLSIDYKYRAKIAKHIIKKILYKYLPKQLFQRPKHGFGVPIHEWLRKDLKQLFAEYLQEDRIIKEGIFRPEIIKIMLNNYLNDKGVNVHKLWFLLMFEMWKERWL